MKGWEAADSYPCEIRINCLGSFEQNERAKDNTRFFDNLNGLIHIYWHNAESTPTRHVGRVLSIFLICRSADFGSFMPFYEAKARDLLN